MLWQGSAAAYAKIFNMKPQQIISTVSQITDPKSGCLKDIKMDIINAVVGFHLLCSCEFLINKLSIYSYYIIMKIFTGIANSSF